MEAPQEIKTMHTVMEKKATQILDKEENSAEQQSNKKPTHGQIRGVTQTVLEK
jgi:hypothetical protein